MSAECRARQHACWLAGSAEVGWLTSVLEQPALPPLSGLVDLRVDDAGTPLLFLPPAGDLAVASAATVAASLAVPEPALGGLAPEQVATVTLRGRLEPVLARDDTIRTRVSALGEEQLVFRLRLARVRYRPRRGLPWPELDLTASAWQQDWREATPGRLPDPLAALLTHLNEAHEVQLRELWAALHGRAGEPPVAVVAAAVRPDSLELAGLAADGVSATRLAFARPVSGPGELAAELLARLGRTRWTPCRRTRR